MDEEKYEQWSVDNINSEGYFNKTLKLLAEMDENTQWNTEEIWWNTDEEKELKDAENRKDYGIAKVIEETTREVEGLNQDILSNDNIA